jgi:hypothetical protein
MNEQQILDALQTLASSQGSYRRFLTTILSMKKWKPKQYKELMDQMVARNLKDTVDLVMYLEE